MISVQCWVFRFYVFASALLLQCIVCVLNWFICTNAGIFKSRYLHLYNIYWYFYWGNGCSNDYRWILGPEIKDECGVKPVKFYLSSVLTFSESNSECKNCFVFCYSLHLVYQNKNVKSCRCIFLFYHERALWSHHTPVYLNSNFLKFVV